MPSDPQERQNGWYWVRWSSKFVPAEYRSGKWLDQDGGDEPALPFEIGQRIPSPDEQAPPIERPEELKDPEAQLERLRGVEFGDLRSYAVLARDSLRYVLALEAECSRLRADNKRLANHPAEGEKI